MTAVDVGDGAPDVEVLDPQGRAVRLSSLWADRPVVLAFLRHYG
jgi:peroxiredoxin